MGTYIFGRNPTREALEAGNVKILYVSSRLQNDKLAAAAQEKEVPVKFVSDNELTNIVKNTSHQGFVAMCEDFVTSSLEDLIKGASGKKYPLLLILDGIEDPHNFGAVLRDCDAFGVDGVIVKSRGEAPLNGTVAKVSAGAINYVKVAVVVNLSQTIEKLKANGYWIVASDGSAKQNFTEIDYKSPIALVVGSEGFGIAPLVLKNSDFIVKIPMLGHVNSLNVSVAAGILLAEIAHSRN
jgi:23S rRNA (guanosine2251-2'-O)-methyltransferase